MTDAERQILKGLLDALVNWCLVIRDIRNDLEDIRDDLEANIAATEQLLDGGGGIMTSITEREKQIDPNPDHWNDPTIAGPAPDDEHKHNQE